MEWKAFSRLESYVRFPIPHIATIALLLHLGLGCCWHHAHSCSSIFSESPAPMIEACGCNAHLDDHANQERHGQSEDVPHRDDHNPHRNCCDGQRCTFIWSESSSEQKGELRVDLCPLDVALSTSQLSYSCQFPRPATSICDDGPPLRAHLLFSVLLI